MGLVAKSQTRSSATAAVTLRRQQVAELWVQGTPTAAIARTLKTPETTIRRDLAAIRDELNEMHHAELEHARARSLAVLRSVQNAAWVALGQVKPNSTAAPAYLNAVLSAEALVAKIEGITQPEVTQQTTVNVLAVPEWVALRSAILRALVPYPEARGAVVEALGSQQERQDGAE